MNDDRDLVDDVLDRALAAHGRAEPRPGLEGRVLAALRSRPPLPWWRTLFASRPAWATVGVLAATAGLAALFLLDSPRPGATPNPPFAAVPGPAAPARAAETPPPAAQAIAELPAAPPPPSPATRIASAPRVPRRASFPEHSPLSEQEQLLLRYVATTPPEESGPRTGFLDEPAPLPALPDASTNQ